MNVGMVISANYCMGEIESIQVFEHSDNDDMACCGSDCTSNDCSTQIVEARVEGNLILSEIQTLNSLYPTIIPKIILDNELDKENIIVTPSVNELSSRYNSPIYLSNCIFLI